MGEKSLGLCLAKFLATKAPSMKGKLGKLGFIKIKPFALWQLMWRQWEEKQHLFVNHKFDWRLLKYIRNAQNPTEDNSIRKWKKRPKDTFQYGGLKNGK
jgi:hypothetical protein